MRALFICTGNAARSQFGQVIYNKLSPSGIALSAGTEAIIRKPMPEHVIEVLLENELSSGNLYRKKLDEELFNEAELVVLMTEKSVPDYVTGLKVVTWHVEDPRGLGLEAHRKSFREIEQLVSDLLAKEE